MLNPQRGEIWLTDLNPTTGREQSGIRPALIISDDNFNSGTAELVIVIPITSKDKNIPLHIQVKQPEGGVSINSYIKCEDIRSISIERLIECWGIVNNNTMNKVEEILKLLLNL